MRLHVKQFLALSHLTAMEAVRQPLTLLLTGSSVILVALMPLIIMHQFGEAGKLVRDSALALHLVSGLVLVAFVAGTTLTREIQGGTAAAVLAKPVPRPLFFAAKFGGAAEVVALFSLAMAAATLLADRAAAQIHHQVDWWAAGPLLAAPAAAFAIAGAINYFSRRPFVSLAFHLLLIALLASLAAALAAGTAAGTAPAQALPWRLLPVSLLHTLLLLIMAALALALAARCATLPTLAICSTVFMLGLMADYLLGRHAVENRLAAVGYALLPNGQHFWAADALAGGGMLPWSYVARAALYAFLYLAALLILGMVSFASVDIES